MRQTLDKIVATIVDSFEVTQKQLQLEVDRASTLRRKHDHQLLRPLVLLRFVRVVFAQPGRFGEVIVCRLFVTKHEG